MFDVLGDQELSRLEQEIFSKLHQDLVYENRMGNLDHYLQSIGCEHIIFREKEYAHIFQILIIGECKNPIKDVKRMIKQIGLPSGLFKFEYVLSYNGCKKYNFKKIEPPSRYDLILLGPMPHSLQGTRSGSIIATIENYADENEKYPEVRRLTNSVGELHISLSNLKDALIDFYEQLEHELIARHIDLK